MTTEQQKLAESYDLLSAHIELWAPRLSAAKLIPAVIQSRLAQEKDHLLSLTFSMDARDAWAEHIARHKGIVTELLHVLIRAGLAEQQSISTILPTPLLGNTPAQSIPPPVASYQPGTSNWSSSSYFASSSWWSSSGT